VNLPAPAPKSKTFFPNKFWLFAAIIWTVGVLILALNPAGNPHWLAKTFSDKVLHAAAFTVGCLLWAKSLEALRPHHRLWAAVVGAVVVLLVGIAIEVLQRYVPSRTCDIKDFWADVVGVLPAVVYLLISSRFRRSK
jgi:VanZ family protein